MTDLLLAWILFPLVLYGLSLGCGRLLRTLLPRSGIQTALLAPAGLAILIVIGGFLTAADATAELATPLAVVLGAAGFVVGGPPRTGRALLWPAVAAAAVFAVYAAPIVLSGSATFAGYIKLDDTATWMALTDRVMEHGHSLAGLAPSTYEATLDFNLGEGYPVGALIPLGIGHELAGEDVAWTIQPYMAALAAMLALALYEVCRPLLASRPLRAAAAFLGAQSALLFGYYLWGGVKELVAAALIATAAALAATALRERLATAALVPLAFATAALAGALAFGGVAWLGLALLAGAAVAIDSLGWRAVAARAALFAGLTLLLSLPVLLSAGFTPPTSAPLTSSDALGNLIEPLDPRQLAGIWPAGDFRVDPDSDLAAGLLVAAAIVGAALALFFAWRGRGYGVLLYVGGTLLACGAIAALGSPWVDGKALAIASPAIPFAAAVAGGVLWVIGRRPEGGLLLAAIAVGVLWSNALAYRDVSLAPREQLAELEAIGNEIAGQGPTLLTDYQPYGARHFLRDADPESVSELRRRRIPLASGEQVRKGSSADTDELSVADLLAYRTLVLRRSPAQSRPPSAYRLVSSGEDYEVWQRPEGAPEIPQRLALGDRFDPVGRAGCAAVRDLAGHVGRSATLIAAHRREPLVVPLSQGSYPVAWLDPKSPAAPIPDGGGEIRLHPDVPRTGVYEIWLGGSVRPEVELIVDGESAGSARHVLNNTGGYVALGSLRLERGTHRIVVRFDDPDLHPGSGGTAEPIGPLTLSPADTADTRLERLPARDAAELCGRRFDWIEARAAVRGSGGTAPAPTG